MNNPTNFPQFLLFVYPEAPEERQGGGWDDFERVDASADTLKTWADTHASTFQEEWRGCNLTAQIVNLSTLQVMWEGWLKRLYTDQIAAAPPVFTWSVPVGSPNTENAAMPFGGPLAPWNAAPKTLTWEKIGASSYRAVDDQGRIRGAVQGPWLLPPDSRSTWEAWAGGTHLGQYNSEENAMKAVAAACTSQ